MEVEDPPGGGGGAAGQAPGLPGRRGPPGAAEEEPPAGAASLESGYLSLQGPCPEENDDDEEEAEPQEPPRAPGQAGPEPRGPPDRSPAAAAEEEVRLKVDFFRKLGYAPAEILGVLQKHGWAADTNTVLGELVRHGAAAAAAAAAAEKGPPERPPEAPKPAPGPRGAAAAGGAPSPHRSPARAAAPATGKESEDLRPVVIDGSNVAMSHGDKDVFSCRGILLAVNWFLERGHKDITVFVPSWRKEQPRPDVPIADQDILLDLERRKILVFTPSRRVGGKRVVCYDDRFIVKLACESDGVVVSNDTYRDLQTERPEWKKFIEERLLMYSFVNDKFMPPDDPLGRHGPSLENFLRKKPVAPEHKKQQCPYGKKCTYGIKCKFFHPERLHQVQRSVADELRANARLSPTHSASAANPTVAKQERLSCLPPQGESLALEGSEKSPLQKAAPSAEKRSSARKGKVGDRAHQLSKAGGGALPVSSSASPKKDSSSSSPYRPPDWYQPPPSSPCTDSLTYVSQDHFDSGIGSLEGQLAEMWPAPSVPSGHYSHQEPAGVEGYRRLGPSYQHSSGPESSSYHPYQPPGYRVPISASSPSFLPYHPEVPSSQAPPPHSFSGYVMPADSSLGPGRKYWSEPTFQSVPGAQRDLQRGPRMAYDDNPSSCPWPVPDRFAEERAKVHVKLCGVFHPHLVDAVMSRFPHLLDTQQLAAEILTYKSQNPRV